MKTEEQDKLLLSRGRERVEKQGARPCERLPMNAQQQSPRIVIVPSLVEFAEIQGLRHTIGGAEANNTGLSSENKSKRPRDVSWKL